MATGRKTGGRVAGTPNRKTREVSELLASVDCDPIGGMAAIALNAEASLELRGRMFAELAQYVYPKRKAVELEVAGGGRVTVSIETVGAPLVGDKPGLIDGAQKSCLPDAGNRAEWT